MMKNIMAKKINSKCLLLVLAMMVLVLGTLGGTVAWLISETGTVVNTFTYGDIDISLTETDTNDNDGNANTNTYNMIPGKTITKDPTVIVEAESEDLWLFVKLEKSTGASAFDTFMEYDMADGWNALDGNDGVYYRQVQKADTAQSFGVIKDNIVKVKGSVTKEMLNAITESPTLKVTAYAVQRDATIADIDTAVEAWALVESSN